MFVSKQLAGLYLKPDMKIDRYETEKSLSPSGQVYLSVQKWYEIHKGVDFISVNFDLTDLKFNSRYESLCAYL